MSCSYFSESIYILQYFNLHYISVSFGITKQMDNKKENNFIHFCNTEPGSSGSPLLLLSTNKVIGIHVGSSKYNNCNIGLFLNETIIDFNRQNRDKMKQILNKKLIDLDIKKKSNEKTILDLNNFWNIKKVIISKILQNNFGDIKIFEKIKYDNIIKLDLSKCNVITIMEICQFKNIKELYLSDNNLINIDNLKNINLDKLEILDLKKNKISDISVFQEINKIRNFRFNK